MQRFLSSIRLARLRHVVRWLSVLALGCGFVLLGSNTADASCGHYVKRLGPGFVPGKAAAARVAADAHSSHTPCGCKGPECRRAPQDSVPLSPQAPVRLLTQQELVAVALPDDFRGPQVSALFSASAVHLSSGYPLRLNRPPAV